jgi:hypothetical protein
MSSLQQLARGNTRSRNLWFERAMAIAATVNLGLVLFNLSYIPWRNFYMRKLPGLTRMYDPLKGIEPHRDTQKYLDTVKALEEQVSQTGLQSNQAETLLGELRRQSVEMIQSNPFAAANKSGALEKIKNLMRQRIYGKKSYRDQSAKLAFGIFWSREHLSNYGWQREISFFEQQIEPLIETNYYRHIGENGEFIDYFWLIDLPFIILFGLEFLARTWTISRRHRGLSWLEAMLWRWYDIFLLLPFWRWLRVIPVTIRLHQAELVDFHLVQEQINRGLMANFAGELAEVIVIRVINQLQGSIQRGEVTRWLLQKQNSRSYTDINVNNDVEAIANLLVKLTVYQVFPKIQPDIEAILRHNIKTVLNQSPFFHGLQNLPGLENLSTQLMEKLATQVTQTTYNALVGAVEDPVGAKLSSQLVQHFSEAMQAEVQKKQTLQKIQGLVLDMLEEIKLNYVKRLASEDVEQVIEERRQLHSIASVSPAPTVPLRRGLANPKG